MVVVKIVLKSDDCFLPVCKITAFLVNKKDDFSKPSFTYVFYISELKLAAPIWNSLHP